MPMNLLRLGCIILILALAGGSCWAKGHSGLWSSLANLARDPWGMVTFLDLGSGLLLASLWMAWREPRRALIPLPGQPQEFSDQSEENGPICTDLQVHLGR